MSEKSPAESTEESSLIKRVGIGGLLQIAATLLTFLMMTLFYTILPIAGLGLLPFLFFGCVCLVVGVCDDLGVYR